jgi:hypothetical protein
MTDVVFTSDDTALVVAPPVALRGGAEEFQVGIKAVVAAMKFLGVLTLRGR